MSIGIIGGTGLYRLAGLELEPRAVTTAFGSVELQVGEHHGVEVVFLARHGAGHELPPHAINYRANIAALKRVGATTVIATSAVGTLSRHVPPGTLALLTDFIDQTSGRARTFFEQEVLHIDYTEPYCPHIRGELLAAAGEIGTRLHPSATYVCTNGPRFETPAEIRMFAGWGADLVGMTNVPEVVLAREAELCYAVLALATNDAAGVARHKLTHSEVEYMFNARMADLARLLDGFVQRHAEQDCPCRHALDEYRERRSEPGLSSPV